MVWWRISWRNSVAALTALIDFAERTGRHDYDRTIARTFELNRGVFPAGVRRTDNHTREQHYLDEAITITDYVHQHRDTSTCGGGVWWNRESAATRTPRPTACICDSPHLCTSGSAATPCGRTSRPRPRTVTSPAE